MLIVWIFALNYVWQIVWFQVMAANIPAVGIDLGTTRTCVGVFLNGKVEIIANDQGNRMMPSYVAFTDMERLIGEAAKNQVATNPTNTIYDAKRLIGRKFADASVQSDIKNLPFKVVSDNGKPKIEVKHRNETNSFSRKKFRHSFWWKLARPPKLFSEVE